MARSSSPSPIAAHWANSGQPIDTIGSILNDPQTGKNAAMAETQFFISQNDPAFGGPITSVSTHGGELHGLLEGDGHDYIHGDVGGQTGWMSDPCLPSRPDLLVPSRQRRSNLGRMDRHGRGRANPDPNTPIGTLWSQQKFTFFDENKQKVTMTPADVVDTTRLGYIYEPLPAPLPRSRPPLYTRGSWP